MATLEDLLENRTDAVVRMKGAKKERTRRSIQLQGTIDRLTEELEQAAINSSNERITLSKATMEAEAQ